MTSRYQLQSKRSLRTRWLVRHYYALVVLAGIAMWVLAYPVSSLYQLSPDEYKIMAEYAFEHDMQYKGKDFLSWRYDWLGVMFTMFFAGAALIGTAIGLRLFFKR